MFVSSRRSLILGLTSLVVAPALVRATSLMHLHGENMDPWMIGYQVCPNAEKIVSCYNDNRGLSIRIIPKNWDKISLVEKVKELNKVIIQEIGSLNNPLNNPWFIARKSELTTRDELGIDYFLKYPPYQNELG